MANYLADTHALLWYAQLAPQLPGKLLEAIQHSVLEITNNHLVSLADLPLLPNHRNPFDRLLIAQALHENLTLVSRDGKFGAYPGLKLQWA